MTEQTKIIDRHCGILRDKFLARLAHLNPEQDRALQSALENGAGIVGHYLQQSVSLVAVMSFPDGRRQGLFMDGMTELETEVFGELCVEVLDALHEPKQTEVRKLLEAGAQIELALKQDDLSGCVWLRTGDGDHVLAEMAAPKVIMH
jgi:hypothetical protein